jgi:hypothetical protein
MPLCGLDDGFLAIIGRSGWFWCPMYSESFFDTIIYYGRLEQERHTLADSKTLEESPGTQSRETKEARGT